HAGDAFGKARVVLHTFGIYNLAAG
ncbi:MAG: hypothetical protein HW384_2181, partial [Dehalococcoidia bacterium]|nr:hypothetical protein [Dehalococcoidia bacterium]